MRSKLAISWHIAAESNLDVSKRYANAAHNRKSLPVAALNASSANGDVGLRNEVVDL
jgi:hypothetical protein